MAAHGPPPLWAREPGFHTLIHIILEQQVSLASARAAYDRLVSATGSLVPERFLALGEAELKAIGFSRQKAHEILDVPAEDYDIMAAVAVGYRGAAELLPPEVAAREQLSERKPLQEVAREGSF